MTGRSVQILDTVAIAVSCLALLAQPALARVQQEPESRVPQLAVRAQAVGVLTRVDPMIAGRTFTEGYILHPILGLNAMSGALSGRLTLNLEGLTLERGELAPGNAGEGYVDRRHPHNYLHEMVGSARVHTGPWSTSLTIGRGFAPFGTDDPMVRPFVVYPTNHHWAQILERWIVIAAVERGPLTLEAGLFNGDEPFGADDLGRLDRFADSWSARATLQPTDGLELQVSAARVASPEHDGGAGLDQRKWSASARVVSNSTTEQGWYALIEWARTGEWGPVRRAFLFSSLLSEAAYKWRTWSMAARIERTTRPEEERLRDGFRSSRPHGDENIIGVTRWLTVSAHLARRMSLQGLRFDPFLEAVYGNVTETTGSIFEPSVFYGGRDIWTLSLGMRVSVGTLHARMGRYGVALHND